ncbi:hypothetical protein A2956_00595 [Candidatus Roizmanbacteria bacterium RIFCSPLOWO2_01_FULL_37_57]|nr:MAG: hypothetical protein A2956_00595 [Candidatus Roizmanbacteria bacterium RIFCSPLOWO2_01_FULL_37_57]
MIHRILKHWSIVLLLLLTFFLRIYKIEELFYFSFDEEVPAFVARKLIEFGDISLLGGVTPFGLHLAPYFYWFLTFLLFFGKLNPIIWGYAGAAIATVTTFMIFLVAKEFFGKKVGFLATSFWTFSYLANIYDRHFWALYWGPLVSLAAIYCLYKIVKGNQKFTYLLAVVLALAIHTDPSNLIFLALTAIVWILYKIPIRKSTIFAVLIIIFSFAPVIVFDLTHNFVNTKPLIKYFSQGKAHPANNPQGFVDNFLIFPKTFSRLIYTFGDDEIAKNYSYCWGFINEKYQAILQIIILFSTILVLISLVWFFKKQFQFKVLGTSILLYVLGIEIFGTLFKSDIFEHYITGLFAIFLIILGFFVAKLPKKIWLIVLAVFVFFNVQKLFSAQNSMGLTYKRQAIEYTSRKLGNKDFSLDSLSTCWRYGGYRYLFAVFGREPVKSYVDPNLAHLYGPTKVASEHPQTVVTLISHDFVPETDTFYKQYARFKAHEVENKIFGNIEVIILDNSKKWFF